MQDKGYEILSIFSLLFIPQSLIYSILNFLVDENNQKSEYEFLKDKFIPHFSHYIFVKKKKAKFSIEERGFLTIKEKLLFRTYDCWVDYYGVI